MSELSDAIARLNALIVNPDADPKEYKEALADVERLESIKEKRSIQRKMRPSYDDAVVRIERAQQPSMGRHRPRVRKEPGLTKSERRALARDALLPADRRCPLCGVVKLESRRWVIVQSTEGIDASSLIASSALPIAVCKSCRMLYQNKAI
jgi:hypothetical protein